MNRILKKYSAFKARVIKKSAQRFADVVISQLEVSFSERHFDYWINMGIYLNSWTVVMHDVYLD